MITANANVIFEAKSRAEAEKLMGEWKLHEGCEVTLTAMESGDPLVASKSGKLAAAPKPERAKA